MQILHAIIYSLVGVFLLTTGGNSACRLMFSLAGLKPAVDDANDVHPAGWIIGSLERLILAIGIVAHSWEVLAAVIALKTVSRFKDLDDQKFAEYFLVGSLFSVLWAIVITSGWLAYDHKFGSEISAATAQLITPPTPSELKPTTS